MFGIRHVLVATFFVALAFSNPAGAVAPDPPSIGITSAGDTLVAVQVLPPGNDGGSAITSYKVTAAPGGANATGPGPFIQVTGLTNGTPYTFTAIATNVDGDSGNSTPSGSVTPFGFPGAPTAASASSNITGQAQVAFTAPASDGGDPITQYRVTSDPGGFTGTGINSPVGIAGLSNGTSYTFTVAAFNNAGFGAESLPSNAVTPIGPPDAPTGASAVAGQGQATVSFTPPAWDGGDPVTSYEVTSSPVTTTHTGTGSPIIVTGLTNGQAYTFTVKAINSMGPSAASAPSNSVTPMATVPGAPKTLARVVNGTALVDVVVTDDGGAAITGYDVTMNPGGATASGATLPIAFNGLTDGVIYTFTSTATNSVGTGPVSPTSHTVRPFPAGLPPSPMVYVPSLDQDDVYVISSRDNVIVNRIPVGAVPTGVAVSPTGTRAFVAASLDDTVYVINTSNMQMIATIPVGTNPTGIAINPAGTRVYVANSDSDTVSVIDALNNTVVATVPMATQPRGIVVSPDGTHAYVTVGVRVRAIDTASNIVVPTNPPPGVIGIPAGIDMTADGTQLYVTNLANLRVNQVNPVTLQTLANTGSAPGQGTGIAIHPNGTIYAARRSTNEIAVFNGTTLTTTIPVGTAPRGVAITPNGTHMYVTNEGSDNVSVIRLSDNAVVATIPVGPFPGALARFIGPPGAPEAPANVSAVAGVASATVSFSPPPYDGGSAVTSYTVTSSIGGHVAGGASSPITVFGLAHGETYTFTVTATNVSGTGAASAPSNVVTTASAPYPPSIDSVIPGNGSVSVAFSPPLQDGGSPITGYTVTCNEIGGSGVGSASGPTSPIVVSGLINGVSYTCTVRAGNAVGLGPASPPSDTVVPQMLPGAPTIGIATAGNASASVAFTPPANDGGQPVLVYTATSNPGGITATGPASPVVVGGLTNGTAYTFTVTATTATGTGLASAASNSVVPSTVPGAPTIGTATGGDGQASVTFTVPASNGSQISSYTVTSNPGGIVVAGTGSPIVVTGLTNGTAYTFTVFANNANGSGPASAASNSVIPAVGQFTLTVAKTGTGSGAVTSSPAGIACGSTCAFAFANGAAVTLTPTAGPGSVFDGWSGACTGTGACIVTMDAAKSVTASFDSPHRLVNISTRGSVGTGDNVLIGGLIVGGPVNKTVVIRARGPSMVPLGIVNALLNPKVDLYSGQTIIATSDDWEGNANAAAVTASGFAPPQSAEAAILINLAPGPYTAIVSGVGGTTGVGLVEVFEVDHPEVPLINIATRGRVQTGNDVMIAGFIIQGVGQQTVVVRARGPSLAPLGVPGVLANPTLTLVRSSDGVVIASNDDWGTAANAAALTASGFAPSDPKEAAILITLDPGAYTAVVSGVANTTGIAIVEVFRN